MSGDSYGQLRSSFFPSGGGCRGTTEKKKSVSSPDSTTVSSSGVSDEDMAALQQMDSVFDEIVSAYSYSTGSSFRRSYNLMNVFSPVRHRKVSCVRIIRKWPQPDIPSVPLTLWLMSTMVKARQRFSKRRWPRDSHREGYVALYTNVYSL